MSPARCENMTWQAWRSTTNGGVNVLYCFLRFKGVTCLYTDLLNEQAKEVNAGAYSAKTLVQLAAKHGMQLRVASISVKELDAYPKPVIVYMTSDKPDDGAFLLVLNETEREVFFVNGSSATIEKMSREDFRRVWSGIVLLPAESRKQNIIYYAAGFSAGFLVWFIIRLKYSFGKVSMYEQN